MDAMTNEELAGRILARSMTMTWAELDALVDAWLAIPYEGRRRASVGGAAFYGAVDGAFSLIVLNVSSFAYSAIGAALAVLSRDSRSESGPFTPAHYEVLTRAWRQVIGAVHPDDDLPAVDDVCAAQEDMHRVSIRNQARKATP